MSIQALNAMTSSTSSLSWQTRGRPHAGAPRAFEERSQATEQQQEQPQQQQPQQQRRVGPSFVKMPDLSALNEVAAFRP